MKKNTNQISVVITNFNGRSLLERNLPFVVAAKNYKRNNIQEIIIVDDASTDDSVPFLNNNFSKDIKLLVNKKNKGFAATTNAGVAAAKGELVCLLNNDVIPSKDFLEVIRKDFADKDVFAVSLHEKGFGYAIGKFQNGFIVHEGKPETNETKETFWASGGSGVFRKNVWEELGGMDEKLMPFYWDDVDLSYRAQKHGYKILWEPKAHVEHHHESTYSKLDKSYVQRMRERNYLLFNWKNLTSESLMTKHTFAVMKKIIRHPKYLRIVLMAKSMWSELMKKRNIEIKKSTVSDEAIFARFN